jgi:hypothetical protein
MTDSLLNSLKQSDTHRETERIFCLIIDEITLLRTGGRHITTLFVCCPCLPPSVLEPSGGLARNLL